MNYFILIGGYSVDQNIRYTFTKYKLTKKNASVKINISESLQSLSQDFRIPWNKLMFNILVNINNIFIHNLLDGRRLVLSVDEWLIVERNQSSFWRAVSPVAGSVWPKLQCTFWWAAMTDSLSSWSAWLSRRNTFLFQFILSFLRT